MTYDSKNLRIFFLCLIIGCLMGQTLYADSFDAYILGDTSSKGTPFVLLGWNDMPKLDGFNIYRKTAGSDDYPETPLNSTPITMITGCADIKAIIPQTSEEWEVIAKSLQPVSGTLLNKRSILLKGQFNPCQIGSVKRGTENWERLMTLARRYVKIARIMGLIHIDSTMTSGKEYFYEIRSVKAGAETILKSNLSWIAGTTATLPAPANIQVEAGDNKVMVTWDEVSGSAGYDVFRQKFGSATTLQVNDAPVIAKLGYTMEGDSISPPVDGYIDYQHWDDLGNPATHVVDGTSVDGPKNGDSYRYQVAARNILGKTGYTSSFSSYATPQDSTPPTLPLDFEAEAISNDKIKLTWTYVTKDEKGHLEIDGVQGYNVYRSDDQTDLSPTQLNTSIIPQPVYPSTTLEFTDTDTIIISRYGEEEYYYRVDVTDVNGNISPLSSAVSAHTQDTIPPAPPQHVNAEGFEEHIRICWDLNTEPDIEAYEIYRSVCDLGKWPDPRDQDHTIEDAPFVFIGEIYHTEAEDSASLYSQACWNDNTLPLESPICYAYWIKARDKSQNKSGSWPYPDQTKEEIVCERLRDKTPPPPPIVTALQARDEAVYIEWVAAPCQDMGAFHVYKSETETGTYNWIGGIKVKVPPTPNVTLSAPFAPAVECECDSIPIEANDQMTSASITESGVPPKTVYFYKVTSLDQNGNESKLDESPPYSTFTFKASGPDKPVIQSVQKLSGSCGLEITWTPAFSVSDHMGFTVFRSLLENGLYRQVSALIQGNTYTDSLITSDQDYWYKIQAFDTEGRPSSLSQAQNGSY
jgi:hypothetical protein